MKIRVSDARSYFKTVKSAVASHHQLRAVSLNLTASENITSPSAREMVVSDLMHRYSEWQDHNIDARWGFGVRYTIPVEKMLVKLTQQLFDSRYCEIRPLSGQVAITATICGLLGSGGLAFAVRPENGGQWYRQQYYRRKQHLRKHHIASQVLNYRIEGLAFDPREWNIDVDASRRLIKKNKPRVLILGQSFFLFPHPVKEMREIADEIGASIVYDGAHVLGLIAGRRWPNPLRAGADVLTGSTHKTLPGPQKGLIITREERIRDRISNTLFPSIVDNHHLMNSAALAIALSELAAFGEDYADQIVRNSKALASALSAEGFDLVGEHKGFTETHQVLVKLKTLRALKAALLLEQANIFATKMELIDANGLRVGVAEVTRTGMREREMGEIAKLFREVLLDRTSPARVRRKVESLASRFQTVHFCFDRTASAYRYPRLTSIRGKESLKIK